MTNTEFPFIPRDISWMSFNYRVLQEAKDLSLPLFERIKFLAIYSNNLDEFFRVRIANHRALMRSGKKTQKQFDYSPEEMVSQIRKIVNDHYEEFSNIFENEIIPELKKHSIYIKKRLELDEEQKEYVEEYFENFLLPYVQPVLLLKNKIRPFLNNAAPYLSINLKEKNSDKRRFALVKIPSDLMPRFVELPSPEGEKHIILLDDMVRHSVSWMFPGYDIIDTYSIKLTRDADLYIDDEFSGDLISKIKVNLSKRHVGPASRFVYDREMPGDLLDFLMEAFELEKSDLLREGRYHNNFDFFKFPDFGKTYLYNTPLPPLSYPKLEESKDFFGELAIQDHLLYFPYHSYESTVKLFEAAATDPKVTHIKITQYRVASKSRIMEALMKAVKSGKQVSVFIEVKARFDEEANLRWGEKLEKAGVNVHYSFPGVKVHSKLALVRRMEEDGPKMYAYLSSGNFHEGTARIYTDYGFYTADTRIINEVARIFSFLETAQVSEHKFEHLLVGQFNMRTDFENLIDYEIEQAKAGKKAKIWIKLNSIQDERMIAKLYEASNAGVKIKMIIRGICCLVPGLKGHSENIKAISIVDRFLEHARVFVFHHGGEDKIYLSSADWMVRNLSHRVECAFPIYDEKLKNTIISHLKIQFSDNAKARKLDEKMSNKYQKTDSDLAVRSQHETYYAIKRELELEKLEEA